MDPTEPLTVHAMKWEKCKSIVTDAKKPISNKTVVNTGLSHALVKCLMTNAFCK